MRIVLAFTQAIAVPNLWSQSCTRVRRQMGTTRQSSFIHHFFNDLQVNTPIGRRWDLQHLEFTLRLQFIQVAQMTWWGLWLHIPIDASTLILLAYHDVRPHVHYTRSFHPHSFATWHHIHSFIHSSTHSPHRSFHVMFIPYFSTTLYFLFIQIAVVAISKGSM